MQNDYTLSAIRHMMIVLNVAIVGFLSAIFFFTPQTAVLHAEAMQFSQQLRYVPELAKKQLEVIASTARNGMNEVRRSVKALRPDALERFELEEALKNL